MTGFDELVREAEGVPVEGWDFSWFAGRATEERPPWGYLGLLSARMATASAALDLQTGGGEVLAKIAQPPAALAATEAWPPNLAIAQRNLAALGGIVVAQPEDAPLPFADGTFDLVSSRHPVVTDWPEIARVLRPGGIYLSQQVGAGSNRELTDAIMGPQPVATGRDAQAAVERATAAGLDVVDLREQACRVTFDDIAAVIVFLRKVIWTVPDFSVGRYRDSLAALHERIERDGPFVAYSQRFLIEARRL